MAPRSPAPCFGSHSGRATRRGALTQSTLLTHPSARLWLLRLPEAHQLYSYGQREVALQKIPLFDPWTCGVTACSLQVGYARELAVPQYNRGRDTAQDNSLCGLRLQSPCHALLCPSAVSCWQASPLSMTSLVPHPSWDTRSFTATRCGVLARDLGVECHRPVCEGDPKQQLEPCRPDAASA